MAIRPPIRRTEECFIWNMQAFSLMAGLSGAGRDGAMAHLKTLQSSVAMLV